MFDRLYKLVRTSRARGVQYVIRLMFLIVSKGGGRSKGDVWQGLA